MFKIKIMIGGLREFNDIYFEDYSEAYSVACILRDFSDDGFAFIYDFSDSFSGKLITIVH